MNWIDATKELPDADINVLVALANSNEVWIGYHDGDDGWRSADASKIEVSHWSEMPEHPNERKQIEEMKKRWDIEDPEDDLGFNFSSHRCDSQEFSRRIHGKATK